MSHLQTGFLPGKSSTATQNVVALSSSEKQNSTRPESPQRKSQPTLRPPAILAAIILYSPMEESVAVSPTQYANLSITIAPESSNLLTGPRSYQGLKGETGEPLLHPRRSCVDILNNYSHGLLVDRSFWRAYLSKPERCIPNAFDVTCAESLPQKRCIATCIRDCRVWRVRDKGAAARHQPVRAASIYVRSRSRHAHQERYAQHHHRTHKRLRSFQSWQPTPFESPFQRTIS